MGIILVGLLAAVLVSIRSHQPDRRIVHPLLVLMPIGFNLLLPPTLIAWSHGMCLWFDLVVLYIVMKFSLLGCVTSAMSNEVRLLHHLVVGT